MKLITRYHKNYFRRMDPDEIDARDWLDIITDFVLMDLKRQKKSAYFSEKVMAMRKAKGSQKGGVVVVDKTFPEKILKKSFPDCVIFDISSTSPDENLRKFSLEYCHEGGIPVPGNDSVAKSIRSFFKKVVVYEVTGEKKNITKKPVMGILDGKMLSMTQVHEDYLRPMYRWVLENKLREQCEQFNRLSKERTVVLLADQSDPDMVGPCDHADYTFQVKEYIDGLL